MAYKKQVWNNYNDGLTEIENDNNNALATPQRMNHIETGIEQVEFSLSQQLADKMDKYATDLTLNMFNEADRAVIQGMEPGQINAVLGEKNVKTENIDEKQVTPSKTTFLKVSSNLIDHSKAAKGKAIGSTSTGTIVDSQGTNLVTLSVLPGEVFTRNETSRFFIYNAGGSYLSSNVGTTYTIPPTGDILRLTYTDSQIGTAQLNKGNKLLPYEVGGTSLKNEVSVSLKPKSVTENELAENSVSESRLKSASVGTLKLKNSAVTLEKTDFMGRSSNIYDPRAALRGYVLLSTTGQPSPDDSYVATLFYPATAGEKITTKQFNRVLYYRSDQSFISRTEIVNYNQPYTFTMPQDGFFRLHGVNIYVDDKAQINRGDTLLPFEEYYLTVDGYKIKGDTSESGNPPAPVDEKPYIFSLDDIKTEYVAKGGSYTTFTLPNLYAAYDSLISQHSDYITKTIYGKDESNEYDVWNLKMIPREYNRNGNVRGKRPKITFIANIHGGEHPSALATYYMVKAICEDWRDDSALEYLRHNVEIEFIPVSNPWGYVTGSYKNINGVNIQTNFPEGWYLRPDPDASTYGGTEPLSEIETVYIKDMIDKNPGAIMFTDLHSAAYIRDMWLDGYDSLFYYLVPDGDQYVKDVEVGIKNAVEKNDRLMKKQYPITTNNLLGYYQLRKGKGTVDAYSMGVKGIPSFVTELFYQLPDETGVYSSDSIKATSEVLVNTFMLMLKRFKGN